MNMNVVSSTTDTIDAIVELLGVEAESLLNHQDGTPLYPYQNVYLCEDVRIA